MPWAEYVGIYTTKIWTAAWYVQKIQVFAKLRSISNLINVSCSKRFLCCKLCTMQPQNSSQRKRVFTYVSLVAMYIYIYSSLSFCSLFIAHRVHSCICYFLRCLCSGMPVEAEVSPSLSVSCFCFSSSCFYLPPWSCNHSNKEISDTHPVFLEDGTRN